MSKNSRKKGPTLYDLFHRDPLAGGGISKNDTLERNFKNFFRLSWWHIGHILSVNMLFIFGNFPFFFGLLAFSGLLNDTLPSPASSVFPSLFGVVQEGYNPFTAALYGIHGVQGNLSVNTTATNVMYGLFFLIFITWGFVNTGTTFILRNLVKGEPVFTLRDFFYSIKRNLLQSFIMGVIDLGICLLLCYDIIFFYFNMGTYVSALMFYVSILLALIYFVMRFYIYIILITFNLSIPKIFKNSFIFSALGMKRHLLALLGIAVVAFIDYYLMILILPLGIILPIIILYGYCAYMGAYAAWPKIKQYMIDPYKGEEEAKKEEETVFHDDVT